MNKSKDMNSAHGYTEGADAPQQPQADRKTERIDNMRNRLDEVSKMRDRFPNLESDEITEQQLFILIELRNEIETLVMEIDPNRFAPVKSYSLIHQEMTTRRLNLCDICGLTRCTSDHI